jgi:aflatoxin B1 aldehyde reductase
LEFEADPNPGRFARLASYRKRYWKKSFFESINLINDKCRELDLKPAQAALRWLAFHSKMNVERGDGIIIGTSNPHQLTENIKSIKDGPLHKELLDTIDEAWNIAQIECPDYFYFYGK